LFFSLGKEAPRTTRAIIEFVLLSDYKFSAASKVSDRVLFEIQLEVFIALTSSRATTLAKLQGVSEHNFWYQ
jgi:hypothetical protein